MLCHCGRELVDVITDGISDYRKCPTHGFQGWIDTRGFELLE